jgi:hypothetical protein
MTYFNKLFFAIEDVSDDHKLQGHPITELCLQKHCHGVYEWDLVSTLGATTPVQPFSYAGQIKYTI